MSLLIFEFPALQLPHSKVKKSEILKLLFQLFLTLSYTTLGYSCWEIYCVLCSTCIVTSKLLKMLKLVPCNSFKRDPNNCRASNTQLNKIMRHNCHSDSRSNFEPLEHSTSDAFNRRGSPMNGSKMIQEKFSFSFIIWCFKKKRFSYLILKNKPVFGFISGRTWKSLSTSSLYLEVNLFDS